jgi:SH3 domain protein
MASQSGAAAAAEKATTVYVTDELRLGLYAGEMTTGSPSKTLLSGAKLEVLERSMMSLQVRTEQGDIGWVKSGYTVSAEPARRRIITLAADNARMETALSAADKATEAATGRIEELEVQLATANKGIRDLPELEQANAALRTQLAAQGTSVVWYWLVAAAIAALAVGWAAGYLWLDRRVRSQFGGVRVY